MPFLVKHLGVQERLNGPNGAERAFRPVVIAIIKPAFSQGMGNGRWWRTRVDGTACIFAQVPHTVAFRIKACTSLRLQPIDVVVHLGRIYIVFQSFFSTAPLVPVRQSRSKSI